MEPIIGDWRRFIEQSPRGGLFGILDDSLHEVGLPSPGDIIPSPRQVIHAFGLKTLSDLTRGLQEKIQENIEGRF